MKSEGKIALKHYVRVVVVLVPLLAAFSCAHPESSEARKREAERAQRLEAELTNKFASLGEQTKQLREDLEKQQANLAIVVPDYKNYHEQLIARSRQVDEIDQLVAARKYGEIAPLALAGFKDSEALAMQFLQKGMEALQASIKAIDANKYSEVSQSNKKAEYFKALAGMATVHEGIFFNVFNTLLLNSPAADRARLFEQAAKTYSLVKRPGAQTMLAQGLQTAYKEEDDADNKKRMEGWLKENQIPESTPAATPATPG